MEVQSIINVGIALIGALGGWVLTRLTHSLDRIDEDLRDIPSKYVAKDDYHRDIDHVKEMLEKIFDKLDTKVDK